MKIAYEKIGNAVFTYVLESQSIGIITTKVTRFKILLFHNLKSSHGNGYNLFCKDTSASNVRHGRYVEVILYVLIS